ncbi:hypothetical protein EG832_01085, partial [bacterium]|nr:hypothetical protein [bacterium]
MDLKVLFNSINVLIDSFSEHSSHVEYLRSFAAIVALFDQYKKHLLTQNMWDEQTHEVVEEIIYWCGDIATKEVLGLQA